MQKQSVLTVFIAISLGGCGLVTAPPCTHTAQVSYAPSAGCLSVSEKGLLVVEDLSGKISPPGGSADEGESAQCAAYRETWEETGLQLRPTTHLATLDTGFHVYLCEQDELSGELNPPPRWEVRQAFYLPLDQFDQWEWRFAGQDTIMSDLVKSLP